jgi:hypothetical protein
MGDRGNGKAYFLQQVWFSKRPITGVMSGRVRSCGLGRDSMSKLPASVSKLSVLQKHILLYLRTLDED